MKQIKISFLACFLILCIQILPAHLAAANSSSAISFEQARLMLKSDRPDVQSAGVEALASSHDIRASHLLMEFIRSHDADGVLKIEAANALGVIQDPSIVHELILVLQKDYRARTGIWAGIIPALGNIGHTDAVPVLIEALNNREVDWLGREMAAIALGQIGSSSAVPALLDAALMPETRHAAIVALAGISDIRAIPIFIDALNDNEDTNIVNAASEGLEQLGESAISEIVIAFRVMHPEYTQTGKRVRLCRLLAKIGTNAALQALSEAQRNESDAEVKACLKEGLAPAR